MKCLFCLGNGAKIRFDKKNRPYYFCSLCSQRIFIGNPLTYRMIFVWSETAKALTQDQVTQMLTNVEQHEGIQHEKVQEWIQEKERVENEVVVL